MTALYPILTELEKWREPRLALHDGVPTLFRLSCTLIDEPASPVEILRASGDRGLSEFWGHHREAELFKDDEFGQWGLHILTPNAALRMTTEERSRRPRDYRDGDLVLGRFYGDSELLILEGARERSESRVRVAMPTDERDDWPTVAVSFQDFLEKFVLSQGQKYWEVRGLQ